MLLGTFTGAINNSVANVAVLEVLDDFDIDVAAGVWFVSAYVLALAVLMPAGGQLATRLGVRRVYLLSLTLFCLASALVAVAPTYELVVTARVMQGVAAAPVLPVVMMTVVTLFPPGMRGRAMGLWASANGAAIAMGPALGGLITDAFGWRAIFWFDVPLAIAALVLAAIALPGTENREHGDVDGASVVLFTLGLTAIMLTLSARPPGALGALVQVGLAITSASLLVAFWRRARDLPAGVEAVIAVSVLRDRVFAALCLVAGLQMVLLSAVLFTAPLMLSTVFERKVSTVGALTFILPLSMVVAGPFCGHLADRVGPRRLARSGAILLVAAAAVLVIGVDGRSLPTVLSGLLVAGVGVAAIQSPTAVSIAERVPDAHRGAAMGLFHTTRFAGAVVGATISAAIVARVASGRLDLVSGADLERSFVAAFLLTALLAAVLVGVIGLLPRPDASRTAISSIDIRGEPLLPSAVRAEKEQ